MKNFVILKTAYLNCEMTFRTRTTESMSATWHLKFVINHQTITNLTYIVGILLTVREMQISSTIHKILSYWLTIVTFSISPFTKAIPQIPQFVEPLGFWNVHWVHPIPAGLRLTDGRPKLRPHAKQIVDPRSLRKVQNSHDSSVYSR